MSTRPLAKTVQEKWTRDDRMAPLRACPLFLNWPEARLFEVASIARVEHYARGTEIFAREPQKREVFIVASGGIEVSRCSAAGKKFVLSVVGPHEVVGLVRLLAQVPIHYEYRAYDDSILLHLPCDGLIAILDTDPILWRDIALLMCARHGDSLRMLNDQTLGSLEQRMAAILLDLARIHGIAGNGGTELGLRLPQEQLGAMLGVTRQSVNRVLRDFERGGLIGIDYNRITIRNALELGDIAAQRG